MEDNTGDGTGKRILGVGLVCLDIINVCDHYPSEDEKLRALSQTRQRGGNAANAVTVLAMLGWKCEFFGTLSHGHESKFVLDELARYEIEHGNCVYHDNCGFPTSCAIISQKSGSRTIIHSRNNLPELNVADFQKLDLKYYGWIHFEGRNNVDEILKMSELVRSYNTLVSQDKRIIISVEIERQRKEHLKLLSIGDVVFLSKDFAKFCGYKSAEDAVKDFHGKLSRSATVVCAWGTAGADGISPSGTHVHSDSYPPEKVIDTLGAGDTFIAGVINCLKRGGTLKDALIAGCKLAGKKCGMLGFDGVCE